MSPKSDAHPPHRDRHPDIEWPNDPGPGLPITRPQVLASWQHTELFFVNVQSLDELSAAWGLQREDVLWQQGFFPDRLFSTMGALQPTRRTLC